MAVRFDRKIAAGPPAQEATPLVMSTEGAGLLAMVLEAAGHRPIVTNDGREALELVRREPGAMVLADIGTPGMSGLELCSALRAGSDTREALVVLLGRGDAAERVAAYRAGANDYVARKVNGVELAARLAALFRARLAFRDREHATSVLASLVASAEHKEPSAGGHAQRSTRYALALAQVVGVSPAEMQDLRRGALLHDVGRVTAPDSVLLKRGYLTEQEWARIKAHPVEGARICALLGGAVVSIVRYHHERWDGLGYPDGLEGEETPLAARIMALADAYDAMTSPRPYRAALGEEQARREVRRGMGAQFDPQLAQAFLELHLPAM